MIPNLEAEYGWAIDAFRSKFGMGRVSVRHTDRGRHLGVVVFGKEYVLYDAPRSSAVYALNAKRGRVSILQDMMNDAASHLA